MKFLIISILTSIILSSPSSTDNPYYPLQKGQVHVYEYTETFATESEQRFKVEVQEETKLINGKVYYIIESSLSSKGEYNLITTSYARTNNVGDILGIGDQDHEEVIFPSRLILNQSWENTANNKVTATKLVELTGSIETPSKNFDNCYVLEISSENTIARSYIQKGVGLVAMSLIVDGEEKLFTYLVSHQ